MGKSRTFESAAFHLNALEQSILEPSLLPLDGLNFEASDLLRARRPLLDTDKPYICSTIAHIQEQELGYSALLDRLKQVERKMQVHRNKIRKSYQSRASTLAPTRRLSNDILLVIFQQVQRRDWDYYGNVFSTAEGPWILGHVCGLWRDTVLSSPSLRFRLSINFMSTAAKMLLLSLKPFFVAPVRTLWISPLLFRVQLHLFRSLRRFFSTVVDGGTLYCV
ncbi:hypothetical protein DFS33DRAFT_812091 [Desarmillaria ectypa]|nr:hypothetical protein DFS33DRAFT_812091 [Desarmillaria ectypa]